MCSDASHQVLAQSDHSRADGVWRFSRWPLGYRIRIILAILNLYVTSMPPIKLRLNLTYGLGGDVIWRISRWRHGSHLGYKNGTILAILNLHVPQCLPLSFSSIQLMVLQEMSKMWKANDGPRMTDDRRQTTSHGIRWPGAKLQVTASVV